MKEGERVSEWILMSWQPQDERERERERESNKLYMTHKKNPHKMVHVHNSMCTQILLQAKKKTKQKKQNTKYNPQTQSRKTKMNTSTYPMTIHTSMGRSHVRGEKEVLNDMTYISFV